MLLSPKRSRYSLTTPALLTRTDSETLSGFSPIIGVPAVIKHNLCLTRKYSGFPFLYSLPETVALNQKRGHKPQTVAIVNVFCTFARSNQIE